MSYFLTVLLFIFIMNVRIFKTNTSFFNASLNLLLITGCYATYITGWNSIYIVLLILLALTHYNKLTLSYDKSGFIQSVIYSIAISPFVYLFQYKNIIFERVAYQDDVFYARIPVWLDELKAESPFSHIEYALGSTKAAPAYYHWFELWLANLTDKINQGNMYINLYVVVFTIICTLICLGLHRIIKESLPNIKDLLVYGLGISFLFIIICTNNLLDLTSLFSSVDLSQFTSKETIYNSLKLIYIVPVCLSVYFVATQKENGLFYPVLFGFFYLIIFPAILGATLLAAFVLFVYHKKIKWEYIIPLIAALLFMGFYKLNGESRLENYQQNVAEQIPTIRHIANWFVKSYIINPIGWIIPIYFLYSKKSELKNLALSAVFLYLSGSGLWLIFYLKLDSHQLFYNITNTFFSFILVLAILDLLRGKKYVIAAVFVAISLFPLQKLRSSELSEKEKIILKDIEPYVKEKIIYLNDPDKVNTMYQYNEVFYTYSPEFFVKYEEIQLLYLNASYPVKESIGKENLPIINDFRTGSRYFQECGVLDFKDYKCLIDFMKRYGFTIIFSEIEIDNPSVSLENTIEDLYVYQLKK